MENERRDLLARIDQLVAEKLAVSIPIFIYLRFVTYVPSQYPIQPLIGPTFYTPNLKRREIAEPSTSSTKRASTSSNPFQTNGHKPIVPPSPSDWGSSSESLPQSIRPSQRSKSSRLKPRDEEYDQTALSHPVKDSARAHSHKVSPTKVRHTAHDSGRSQRPLSPTRVTRQEMRSESRQQAVRRVQATIEIPVKEEEVDDEELGESISAQPYSSSSASVEVSPAADIIHVRKPKTRQNKRSTKLDDNDSYTEGPDEGERQSMHSSSSEDEDELMMGAEVGSCLFMLYANVNHHDRIIARKFMVHIV